MLLKPISWLSLLACLSFLILPLPAQDDGNGAGEGEGFIEGQAPVGPNADGDNRTEFDAELDQLGADLGTRGLEVPEAAFDIFPASVKSEIQSLITALLPVIDSGDQAELDTFFSQEGDRIATVFDQLGLSPNAESLLDNPLAEPAGGSTIKFPDEFANYEAYLESLELEDFEREYMLASRGIAVSYETNIASALGDRERVQSALETYQTQLESLNERYEEQFRELSLESIERAGADGQRPDIDR